ncbi:insulinase family protein, partial [candidate division KSB1 bacterium]
MSFAVAKNNEASVTISTLLTENERVKQFGFTETELERTKEEILSDYEKSFNERNKKESQSYMWEYFSHFLNMEPTPGIEWEFESVKALLPGITLDEINRLTKTWVRNENRVVAVMAPEKEDAKIPDEAEIMKIIADVASSKIEAYIDKVSDKPLIGEMPDHVKVGKKKTNKNLGYTEWILKNGVKVILKPTEFKDDEVRFSAFSVGGNSKYEVKDYISAELTTDVIESSGLSEFDQIELDKKLSGKVVSVSPFISELQEGFNGRSSKADFESMLQLIYLYFTKPRVDEKAFSSLISRYKGVMENKAADPRSAFSDTVTVTLNQYSPYKRPWSVEILEEAKFKKIDYIFKDRFGDPSNFTFFFVGNINLKEAKPLIEKYLGALPVVNRNESWKDLNIRPPQGIVKKRFYRKMEVPKSTNYVAYTGNYEYTAKNRILLDMIADILDIRYTESIREEQSGTYGVGVWVRQSKYPYQGYKLNIRFDCDPANTDKLMAIVYEEIDKIRKEGPLQKDLHNTIENKLKERAEDIEENSFWLRTLKNMYYHGEMIEDINAYNEIVKGITAEDIKKAINDFLKADNYIEIIMMPEKVVEEAVE